MKIRTILLSLSLMGIAPAAGATPAMASLRVQQTVAARVAHRAVRQQDESLRHRLDLDRQRSHREERQAQRLAPSTVRQP